MALATVLLGPDEPAKAWPMASTGERPSTKSTSGRLTFSKACLACVERLSTYFLCPSAAITSKTNEDLPDPLTPVTPISLPLGISTVRFFKLFSRARLIKIHPSSKPEFPFFFATMNTKPYVLKPIECQYQWKSICVDLGLDIELQNV